MQQYFSGRQQTDRQTAMVILSFAKLKSSDGPESGRVVVVHKTLHRDQLGFFFFSPRMISSNSQRASQLAKADSLLTSHFKPDNPWSEPTREGRRLWLAGSLAGWQRTDQQANKTKCIITVFGMSCTTTTTTTTSLHILAVFFFKCATAGLLLLFLPYLCWP